MQKPAAINHHGEIRLSITAHNTDMPVRVIEFSEPVLCLLYVLVFGNFISVYPIVRVPAEHTVCVFNTEL